MGALAIPKTVLVTGATGCVGANVVAALSARGHTVRAMHRHTSLLDALEGLPYTSVIGDVLEPATLLPALEGCDWVFHVAAVSEYWRSSAGRIYQVNLQGTRNVLAAAAEAGVQRLVFTSSVATLGSPACPGQLLDEGASFSHPPGRFPYAHSKYLAEQEVLRAAACGLDAVIVNPATVIGARDVHFIGGELLRQSLRGRTFFSPPGGMGVVDAETAGLGHVLAAEHGRTGERYVLNGENITHRALLETIAEVVGGRRPSFTLPAWSIPALAALVDVGNALWPGQPLLVGEQLRLGARSLYFDASKAEQVLGLPLVGARQAVERAAAWYRTWGWL